MMTLYFYHWKNEYLKCALKADGIIVPYGYLANQSEEIHTTFSRLQKQGVLIYAALPAISAGYHDEHIQRWANAGFRGISRAHGSIEPDGIYIGNQGQLAFVEKYTGQKLGDAGLNVYNSASVRFWKTCGLDAVTLSYELEPEESFELLNAMDSCGCSPDEMPQVEALLYGRVPVMISEYCPVAGASGISGEHCGKCEEINGPLLLKSRRGEQYPVLLDSSSCRTLILSAKTVIRQDHILKKALEKKNVTGRICVFEETAEQVLEIMQRWSYLGAGM